jgi:superfamily II DNA or RNA helicase
MLNEIQNELLRLLEASDNSAILELLKNLPEVIKGKVFEAFLSELLRGNGYLTEIKGGRGDGGADILVYHSDNTAKPISIIQAKNQSRPLSYADTLLELTKFEKKARTLYRCSQFQIVSLSGFVKDAYNLKEFNLTLLSWEQIVDKIRSYDSTGKCFPGVDLTAYNQCTYDELTKLFKSHNRVAAVQATGTGKSYLIAQLLADHPGKKVLMLAPSNEILRRLKENFHWIFENCDMMTYQKMTNLKPNQLQKLVYDLIIIDEYHRAGAKVWGSRLKSIFDANPSAKIFGTSATPLRYLDGMRDMTLEIFGGKKAAELTLEDAIAKKILPEPKYVTALFTLKEELNSITKLVQASKISANQHATIQNKLQKLESTWEQTLGVPHILNKHLKPENNKIIVFCEDTKHLDAMEPMVSSWFQKAFPGRPREIKQVFSQNRDNDRHLEEFRKGQDPHKIYLLLCINMLNEGLHFEDVNAVILLRPTKSPNIFFQQIGRCLAVNNRHQPIIFDFVNNCNSICSNEFKAVLEDAIKKENLKRKQHGLDESDVSVQIDDYTVDVSEVLAKISKRLNPWEQMFEELLHFKSSTGHCNVPLKYPTNRKLGFWVNNNRKSKKKGRLSQQKIDQLERIGFEWERVQKDPWINIMPPFWNRDNYRSLLHTTKRDE